MVNCNGESCYQFLFVMRHTIFVDFQENPDFDAKTEVEVICIVNEKCSAHHKDSEYV